MGKFIFFSKTFFSARNQGNPNFPDRFVEQGGADLPDEREVLSSMMLSMTSIHRVLGAQSVLQTPKIYVFIMLLCENFSIQGVQTTSPYLKIGSNFAVGRT